MSILISGRTVSFVLLVFAWVCLVALIELSKKGSISIGIREPPALAAMDTIVARCAEIGRPMLTGTGHGVLSALITPEVVLASDIVYHLAKLCAKYNVRLIISVGQATWIPLALEKYREGLIAGGRPDLYKEEDVRYLTHEQWAYAAGHLDIMVKENVGGHVVIGSYMVERLHFGETATEIGAMGVGGAESLGSAAFMMPCYDYVLLGEEIYAAGAILSEDPHQVSSIAMEDYSKIIMMAIYVIGSILLTFGFGIVINFLNM